jgi:hypothetical protein
VLNVSSPRWSPRFCGDLTPESPHLNLLLCNHLPRFAGTCGDFSPPPSLAYTRDHTQGIHFRTCVGVKRVPAVPANLFNTLIINDLSCGDLVLAVPARSPQVPAVRRSQHSSGGGR